MPDSDLNFLTTLETIIQDRRVSPVAGSYTTELFAAGSQRIAQKVGEEAIEVALASCHGDMPETKAETADLLYHLLVLLTSQGIKLSEVVEVLEDRHTQ